MTRLRSASSRGSGKEGEENREERKERREEKLVGWCIYILPKIKHNKYNNWVRFNNSKAWFSGWDHSLHVRGQGFESHLAHNICVYSRYSVGIGIPMVYVSVYRSRTEVPYRFGWAEPKCRLAEGSAQFGLVRLESRSAR